MDQQPAQPAAPLHARRAPRAPCRLPSRLVGTIGWTAVLVLLALSACWFAADRAWGFDLAGNLAAQWLMVSLVLTLTALAVRRRRLAAAGLLACALNAAALSIGRAAILPRPIDPDAAPAAGTVRFFHYNASTRGEGRDIEAVMASSRADVLSLLCPSVAHQRSIIYGRGLEDRYAGKITRPFREDPLTGGADITAAAIFSRWPIRRLDTAWAGPAADYLLPGIVQRPRAEGGPFAVIGVHPRSPRSPARWQLGNQVVRALGAVARRLRGEGYPVIVLADLNATPSGHRSRVLFSDAGLSRAKPLLVAAGTYPVPLGPRDDLQRGPPRRAPWPLSVALDDALVSPGVSVRGWGLMPRLESEHRPILIDLSIPPGPEIQPPPANR